MSVPDLDVIWDAAKAKSNIAKHGVTFAHAATVLLDPLALTVFDAAHSASEDRWFTLGRGSEGKLLTVSLPTGPADAQVRIISARAATRSEREQYKNEPR